MFEEVEKIKTLQSIGGKSRLLKTLIPIIRHVYKTKQINGFLDLFGGGNKFVPHINKNIVAFRLYNDLDTGTTNLMACLSNWIDAREVVNLGWYLQRTIKTKEAFNIACKKRNAEETSMIESAALTMIVAEYSRAADRKNFCAENANKGITYSSLEKYKQLVPLLEDAVITCSSYEYFFQTYGHRSDFLTILDPPYVDSNIYENGFTREDHEKMCRLIVNTNMKVMLCGTDNDIYKYLEDRGWNKYFVGAIPKNSSSKKGEVQLEYIWCNFSAPSYMLPRQ